MNVDAYLQRLDYDGPLTPTAETLRRLHLAHLQHVPFENLGILRGRPIVLDPASLFEKIVARRRGGFCYELNGLFAWLLREIGFDVRLLSAGVADDGANFSPDLDHLTLQVRTPAAPHVPWLADVGFGDCFRRPLRLDQLGLIQPDPGTSNTYRIDAGDTALIMQEKKGSGPWEKQYRFKMEPRRLADFRERCLHHQTSPQSHFTQGYVCTRATADGRITLTEEKLITTSSGKRLEQPVSQNEYNAILQDHFGIKLPQ